jgi:hypothetical protein
LRLCNDAAVGLSDRTHAFSMATGLPYSKPYCRSMSAEGRHMGAEFVLASEG